MKRNFNKLPEQDLGGISMKSEQVINGIKQTHTNFILISKVFYKLEIRQLILGSNPRRWAIATIKERRFLKKKTFRTDLYDEGSDLLVTFDKHHMLKGFKRPQEQAMLIKNVADPKNVFYTKRRREKRSKQVLKLSELKAMEIALQKILQKYVI